MRSLWIGCVMCLGLVCQYVNGEEVQEACQVYFSPADKIAERLIDLVNSEQKSIRAAVYCLTHRGIVDALTKAKQRGVDVEIIVDPFSMKRKVPMQRLAQAGIPVFVWDPATEAADKKTRKALMHDKFCVFGTEAVWTGSFNLTHEAEGHQENVVLLRDKRVAGRYLEQFKAIKSAGCRSYADYKADHTAGPRKKK